LKKPMRIVLFLRSLLYGGTERQVVTMATELQRRGHDVLVLTLYGGEAYAADLTAAGVPHHNLEKRGRYDILQAHLRMIRQIRNWRPDVVYSFLPAQNVTIAALSWLLPGVKTVFGVRAADLDSSKYDWLARFSYRAEALAARTADLVVANSQAGLRWCSQRGFPVDRLSVIPNGIDTAKFQFDAQARARIRTQLRLQENQALVANIARLDVMKDHPTFLCAAAQLMHDNPSLIFACIGNGPAAYADHLRQMAVQLGLGSRLLWLPAQESVQQTISAADICVLSSAFGEGFPNVVAEAMACKVPVVATDTGDCRIIMDGLLPVVAPGDGAAMAWAMRDVAARLSDSAWRDALRARIEERYSNAALGRATENVLQSLI
jgi:glycosyltransferase involved in cell wall biosynthesis